MTIAATYSAPWHSVALPSRGKIGYTLKSVPTTKGRSWDAGAASANATVPIRRINRR